MTDVIIETMLASGDIKLPAVPGTRDDSAVQSPFGQRTSGVRADTVQREEFTINMEQRDDPAGDNKFTSCTAGNGIDRGDFITIQRLPVSCQSFGDRFFRFFETSAGHLQRVFFPILAIEQFQ